MVSRLRYLLDTDICIYIKKYRPIEVRQRLMRQPPGSVAMSAVSWGELMFGAQQSRSPDDAMAALEELSTHIGILPLPMAAGAFYGELRATLARDGQMMGANDIWIAAHALAEEVVLVTNNTREFCRVPDLRIENWVGVR